MGVLAVAFLMAGHAPVLVEDRDSGGGHAYVELFAPELMGNAVIVAVYPSLIRKQLISQQIN